ncbi:MAG TPA: DMT family transporter [Bacteroidales bacterium]
MKNSITQYIRSESLLLITAVIWGFAFVAQRAGMEYIGPFTYNGIRFALGSLVLVPFIAWRRKVQKTQENNTSISKPISFWLAGIIAGVVLFGGASLQQVGITQTTAGKAGFITGLYVIIVPIIGIFKQQHAGNAIWVGALLAIIGMYLLSITGNFKLSNGDFLVFLSAFLWAVHVQVIDHFSGRVDVLKLAALQFALCAIASICVALITETITLSSILQASIPILYGGILSVGIAYTLQVVAQQKAHPSHAAIILSLETVFAALGGWMILDEHLSARALAGCALMLTGMLIAQLYKTKVT